MKKMFIVMMPALLLFGCSKHKTHTSQLSADGEFERTADDYLAGYLAWRPGNGVALGYHQYDGKAVDFSKESLGRELGRLKDFDQ